MTARLPCKSDTKWQRETKWMLSAVGLDVTLHRDVVLQAWFHEEAHIGRQMVLQSEAEGRRELPRSAKNRLVADFILPIHKIVGMEDRAHRDFGRQAKTSVEAPVSSCIQVTDALYGYAEVVDGLLLTDGVAVGTHLEI